MIFIDLFFRDVDAVGSCGSDAFYKHGNPKKSESEKNVKDQSLMLKYIKTQVHIFIYSRFDDPRFFLICDHNLERYNSEIY